MEQSTKKPPMNLDKMEETMRAMVSEAESAIREVQAKYGDAAAADFARELSASFKRQIEAWIAKHDPAKKRG